MFIRDRRGIVGFMLTMALGIALGAATLLVGNEVAKGVDKKKVENESRPAASTPLPPNSAQELEEAFQAYRQARCVYDEALSGKVTDLRRQIEVLKKAKIRLERAILLNTPGIATLDPASPKTAPQAISSGSPFADEPVSVDDHK